MQEVKKGSVSRIHWHTDRIPIYVAVCVSSGGENPQSQANFAKNAIQEDIALQYPF
jgi:hypothetical protein